MYMGTTSAVFTGWPGGKELNKEENFHTLEYSHYFLKVRMSL
jgi:hypothetical protein